ncbi:large conductance mechanosensitive channel protein MscL [Fodinicurvata sp. EGI_FJ10296]|uniref:large conductance mechanosensitive channel protein MscL n=1 Tax=Fodinicurvata sp. EGI_FJ10296 TaxID=3231908 RepID=UPI003455057A
MLNEFKAFIARGNVIDLAVGLVLGAAFTTIVNSLVNDILMPPIGLLMGGMDFSNIFITLSGGSFETLVQAQEAGAATMNIGLFINAVVQFLIVGAALFVVIKQINRLRTREKESTAPPPPPTRQEELLEQIRDLLARKPGDTPTDTSLGKPGE